MKTTMIARRGLLICGGVAATIGVWWARALVFEGEKESRMDIDIKRNGSRPSQRGSADWFTGTVRTPYSRRPSRPASAPVKSHSNPVPARPGTPIRSGSADHHGRARSGAARGRPDRGSSSRRHRVVSARETLARRFAHGRDDSHRHPGIGRRQERRLDGEGQRRAVREGAYMSD